jgi:hypothetical protein
MLGKLLEYGSVFDWISPTLSIAQDLAYGPSHTFLIPADCGLSGREIINLLRQRGIKTWGHMIVNGTIMITVRDTQTEFARYLMQRAGLPVDPGPDQPPRSRSRKATSQSSSYGLGDLLREIGNIRL